MNIQQAIKNLIQRHNLSGAHMQNVMNDMMTGKTTDAQIGAFLIALTMKGEAIEEISAAATVMRQLSTKLNVPTDKLLVDTCGTGGDGLHTFNISTAAALVVAAAGVQVAKHGNRSVSSQSGSADLLELAGVKIDADLATVKRCIEQANIGFMFAPLYHPSMKYAAGVRRELAVKTVFNILGPLTNPAGAKRQVIGVFDKSLLEVMAKVLHTLGSEHVMCVHSEDGLDEISIAAKTQVCELKDGKLTHYQITPEQFGFNTADIKTIQCTSAQQSLEMIQAAINGQSGSSQDVIALNAGAAIYVSGAEQTLEKGVVSARSILNSGAAQKTLTDFIHVSNDD